MRPKVSLCMIVRDEAHNLHECLAGMSEIFDEIIVVDTGSKDDTRAIAASLGAKVSEFPWCDDFAVARNVSRSRASGEWIFWHDADDRIDEENRAKLKRVIESLPEKGAPDSHCIRVVTCRCGTCDPTLSFDIAHARLFRNDSDLRWRGRIHEHLVHGSEARAVENSEYVFTDVVVRHSGYETRETFAAKQRREQRILEKEYMLHPDDAATSFYLGRLLAQLLQWDRAVPFLRRTLTLDPHDILAATPKAASILLVCLDGLGRQSEAAECAAEIARRFPYNFEVQFRCGSLYRKLNRNAEAKACLQRSIEVMARDAGGLINQSRAGLVVGLDATIARMALAEILYGEGNVDAAVTQLHQVLVESPQCLRAHAMLGEISIRCGQLHQAEKTAEALSVIAGGEFEHALLRSMLATHRRRFTDAKRWARRAVELREEASAGWITLGHALEEEAADWQGSVAAYERAHQLCPNDHLRKRLDRARAVAATLSARPPAAPSRPQAEAPAAPAGWTADTVYAARPA